MDPDGDASRRRGTTMNARRSLVAIAATLAVIQASAAAAAAIDMDDPRRALGSEGAIRVDAQILQETVSPGSSIGVTYQIVNGSASAVAVADRVASASFDPETGTITLAIGAEVPDDGRMPLLTVIKPGETKVFSAGATPPINGAVVRAGLTPPRQVQVKVSILRDLAPFEGLITRAASAAAPALSDELFDRWFESTDTIFLNTVPVRFAPRGRSARDSRFGADRASADRY